MFSILDCPLRRRNMPKAKSKSKQKPILNPVVSAKTDLKIERILNTLQIHWKMGCEISADDKLKVKEYAINNGIDERTVRERRTFYKEYPLEEFEKFRNLRFSKSKLPLDSGYIRYLVTIKSPVKEYGDTASEARYAFAKFAADNDYSKPRLHAFIKDELAKRSQGKPKATHGRKPALPDRASAIEVVAHEAVKWIRRCEVAIEFISAAKPSKTLEALLSELSIWSASAAKLCNVPKDAESDRESMRQSLEKILALHSTCIAEVKKSITTKKRQSAEVESSNPVSQ